MCIRDRDKCSKDDTIIIHDGIRPLVDAEVLADVICKAQKYGNAVTSLPYNCLLYTSCVPQDQENGKGQIGRLTRS